MSASKPKRFRHSPLVLALSMLVMGACGIAYEYALGLLGNNLIGSSHEQIFVIIGIMMFAMGLGAVAQKNIVGDLLDRFLWLELALGMLGGVSTIVIYATYVYSTSYMLVTYLFAFSIGFAIGLEIPLLIRINSEYADSLRANLSEILCMDYVGSLIGALLFTYLLVTRLSLGRIAVLLGIVNTLLAVAGVLYFWPLVRRPRPILWISLVWLVLLAIGLGQADAWTARLEQRTFQDPIVHSQTTRFQHLVLTQRGDHTRLYINGHLQFSSRDEVIYHELLVHPPMAAAMRKEKVLILGGGDGLALRDVLRYDALQSVTLVDIDPGMIELARDHPALVSMNRAAFHDARVRTVAARGVTAGERVEVVRASKLAATLLEEEVYPLAEVHVVTIDADQFVRSVDEQFNVIIIDFPDPRSIELAKLYSVDFYRSLARILAPGGMMSIQSTSPYRGRKVFLSIGLSLREAGFEVLPYQDHLESFGDWGWHLAWLGPTPARAMRQRFATLTRLEAPTRYLTVEKLNASFAFGKGRLEPPPGLRANTKLRPVLLDYYRQGLD